MLNSSWARLHAWAAYLLIVGMALSLWAGLVNASSAINLTGAEQTAQRIFYAHMGTNMMALVGFLASFGASIIYLLRRKLVWDSLATAGVEVGLVGGLGTLISGSIWAKPAWGTYWTWDPRLTTATIVVLIYIAYLQLRNGLENPQTRGLFAAIYAVLAYGTVPLTYYSAIWFRSIHPMMFLASNPQAEGEFVTALGPSMGFALQSSIVVFVLLGLTLVALRWRMLEFDGRVRTIRGRLI